MVDPLTPQLRSAVMARIRCSNTKPEISVRKLLLMVGYRFRVQLKGVPGRPDVGFLRRRKIIQIHC